MNVLDDLKFEVILDRLTVVGSPVNQNELMRRLQVSPFITAQWISPNAQYHYNYKCGDHAFMQMTHAKAIGAQIRLDFNPAHFNKNTEKHIMQIMRYMKNVEPTRIDAAIDLWGEDLSSYKVYDARSRKQQEFRSGAGRWETINIGSNKSDEQVTIYDKAVEQKIDSRVKWWRIEGQLRKDKSKAMGYYNPFKGVLLSKPKECRDYDIRTRAMIEYLKKYPEQMTELSKDSRSKYKQLIAATGDPLTIDPYQVYEENKEKIQREILSWLNISHEYQLND